MYEEKYYTGQLYVIIPSRIVYVDGKITKSKINKTNYVNQTVIFEREEKPVIAYNSLLQGCYDIFNNGKNNYHSLGHDKIKYFDVLRLDDYGVTMDDEVRKYYNIFNGDRIPLQDYIFGRVTNNNIINRLAYFKYPFDNNNMELKPKISKKLVKAKQFYTKNELEEIIKNIDNDKIELMQAVKTYKVVKQAKERMIIDNIYNNPSTTYAGIDEDIDTKRQKSLQYFKK